MKIVAIPFVIITVLAFTTEIIALVYGFYKGVGFWSVVGWAVAAEFVLRGVWFVSTMIVMVLGAKK